jgi:glycine hydroxymethyltransferase
MTRIVELIDEALTHHADVARLTGVRHQVNEWLQGYPLFQ